jgi:nucleoside-diphosphate-sugar epimerase
MSTALIGYTGFVGGNLLAQAHFDHLYHSKNIGEICGKAFEMVVCAGAPAAKWKANQFPQEDFDNIRFLMDNLDQTRAIIFVLISTVDVYPNPDGVSETTLIDETRLDPYGRHRYMLERFVVEKFPRVNILRLPGLYGPGLKKNIIYDLLHQNALHLTHHQSVFQFYNLRELWKDMLTVLHHDLPLVNISTEPVSVDEIANACFDIQFLNVTEKPPIYYDMRTELGRYFGVESAYLYDKTQVITGIRQFVQEEMRKIQP